MSKNWGQAFAKGTHAFPREAVMQALIETASELATAFDLELVAKPF